MHLSLLALVASVAAGPSEPASATTITRLRSSPSTHGAARAEGTALLDLTLSASQSPMSASPGAANLLVFSLSITNNDPLFGRSLRGLRLTNATLGPGSAAQLDAELDVLRLYRDNGNQVLDPGDVLLAQAVAQSGAVLFSPLDEPCPAGATVRLLVATAVPLAARDGDALDLLLQSGSDVTLDQPTSFSNAFPLSPAGSFPINGMTAAQIATGPIGSASVIAGSANNLALNVVLPANGYEADQLQQLAVINTGTAAAGSDIGVLRAWVDDGDGAFAPGADRGLGALAFTGARWQLTGLGETVPVGGLRLFLSVDVPTTATNGRTIRLALPSLPDVGIGMASTNDGPLDRPVESPIERTVSTSDRVTLAAASLASTVARPGQLEVILLHVLAANSYATTQVLNRLTATNAGIGGAALDRDRAIQSLRLRVDGNGDGVLGDSLLDPVLATGFFTEGKATFAGLGHSLAPGVTRHFYVTGQVALTNAADGDTLSARLKDALDIDLGDTTRVVSSWPLDSRARVAVDGMVAAQLTVAPTAASSLAPDDADVLALDLIVPRNGHADDTLEGIELVNLGSATESDIAEARLWRDGGDGVAMGGGDDRDLGPATWNGSGWSSAPLAEPLGNTGARLFVLLRLTSAPRDSATVQIGVPVNGLRVASGNDGPLDRPVASPTTLLISNSPLLASLAITPQASTPGQVVDVAMELRNVGTEDLLDVAPSTLASSGSGGLTPQSGPTPPSVDLAPGGRDTLRWTYVASQVGTVRLTGRAAGTGSPSGAPRQSLEASSSPHQVFSQATQLEAAVSTSLPATANRGQAGLVAVTLHLTNGEGADASPIRFRALRLALWDEAGAGIVPDQLLARVSVHEGVTERLGRTSLESSGEEVDLTLAAPVVIGSGESVDLTVSLDLLSATMVPGFRVALLDASWLVAEDATSGAPVVVDFGGASFPILSRLTRVVEPPTRLEVTTSIAPTRTAGPGQADVLMQHLRVFSPGTVGITDDVRLAAFALDASDTLGSELSRLADAISWVRVRSGLQTIASRAVLVADGSQLTLTLSPPLTVPVNTALDVLISGDIAVNAAPAAFRLRLVDSTRVDARDATTRSRVPVVMAEDPLPGPAVLVEARAETVLVRGSARFPAAVRAGEPDVSAMRVVAHHPGRAGTAPVEIESLTVVSRDEARRPLPPASYVARLRVLWNGLEAGRRLDPPASGEATSVPLTGCTLAAGDSAALELLVDFSATAPEGLLELSISGDGIAAFDSNLRTPVVVAASAGELPLLSGLTRLQAPPRSLLAGLTSLMPAALAGDGREVSVATLLLTNPASAGAGTISVAGLTLRGADRNFSPVPVGSHASSVVAYVGGVRWAQSSPLTADSVVATLAGSSALAIAPGTPAEVELRMLPRMGTSSGTLRLGVDAAGVGVVQPGSALLQIQVQPEPGQTFPLWSASGSFSPLDLAASYSNFPNPFAAGREATSFAYYLERAGQAWLRLTTLDGEPVVTLLSGQHRPAGLHQEDRWEGRNGVGRLVRSGVYLAELIIQYDDGSRARAFRKVAVVR